MKIGVSGVSWNSMVNMIIFRHFSMLMLVVNPIWNRTSRMMLSWGIEAMIFLPHKMDLKHFMTWGWGDVHWNRCGNLHKLGYNPYAISISSGMPHHTFPVVVANDWTPTQKKHKKKLTALYEHCLSQILIILIIIFHGQKYGIHIETTINSHKPGFHYLHRMVLVRKSPTKIDDSKRMNRYSSIPILWRLRGFDPGLSQKGFS